MSFLTKPTIGRSLFLLGTLCSAITLNAQQSDAGKSVLSMERNKIDGTPSLIRFSPEAKWKKGDEQKVLQQYLGIDGVNTTMRLQYATTTRANATTSRYAEYYKGIKVEYGSFTLTEKDGRIQFISGNFYKTPAGASAAPAITEGTALNKALDKVGATRYMWQDPSAEANLKETYNKPDTSYYPKGRLVWIENFYKHDRQLHLAYAFNVYAQVPMSRQMMYVDATDGSILYAENLIKHTAASNRTLYSGVVPFVTSKPGSTYTLYDSTRGGGIYTRNVNHNTSVTGVTQITSTTNNWPTASTDTAALDVHWGVEKVYDYWFTQQGRDSWDGMGGILLSYIHMNDASTGGNMDNAYWNGSEMCYGDGTGCSGSGAGVFLGPLTPLDVTGHELGHGICQATAGLVYELESGAINEGLSDCWGATVEHWADPHETDAQAKLYFKIGEEIGCGHAPLRSMDYPHNESNPDTYGTNDPFWVDVVGCIPDGSPFGNDNCGVHTNSGVTNKWYYLVVSGGTGTNANGNSYNVNAIGWTEAAQILYQTELALSSTADYAEFRNTSIAVATALYGACSAEVQCVTNAWYAVGVGAAFTPCSPQLGFTVTNMDVTENAGTTACPASHTITVGIQPNGPTIAGGNPTVNIVAAPYSTAVAGVDYTITGGAMTFLAGDVSTHYATITIYDNGAVNDDKKLILGFTLNAMGTGTTVSPLGDSVHINILNDDSSVLTGGVEYHTLSMGAAGTCNVSSAFQGSNRRARTQWIITAAELAAAGVRPNAPISQIGFNITSKSSTSAFVNYTLNMANTTATDVSTGFVTAGLVTVFSANHTTNLGLDTLNFSTNFTWDGTSNIMVQACYGNNASNFTANDQMAGLTPSADLICAHNQSTGTGGSGCALGWSGATADLVNIHPVMRFKQTVPPSKIATVLGNTRSWSVAAGTQVPFFNAADTALIATLNNTTANLGCTNATVSGAGTGFTPSAFSSGTNRSVKQVTITPTINGATTTYDVTMYMTNTELNSVSPSSLFLVKTEQATDATITPANSVLVTPALVTGTNYVGFKGTFTGVTGSRFFLTDGPICASPATTITASGPVSFCAGSSVTLSAPVTAGATYQWQNGTTNIPGATNSSYTTNTAGNYRVIVSSGGCQGISAATTVIVNANPVVAAITGTTSVCPGAFTTLSNTTPSGTWSSNAPAVATVSGGVVGGSTTGTATISYSVTNGAGCTAYSTTLVTVLASPATTITASGPLSFCPAGSVTLSAPTGTGLTYQWLNGGFPISGSTSSSYHTNTAGNYAVTVTNSSNCSATSAVSTVAVNASFTYPPSVSLSSSPVIVVCFPGSPTTLTPTPVNGGSSPHYDWYVNGTPAGSGATYSYVASEGDIVKCLLTSNDPCLSVDTASTIVSMTLGTPGHPMVGINAIPNDTVCAGVMATFAALPSFGGTAPSYIWNKNGINVATGPAYNYVPTNGDLLKVTMTSNYNCRDQDTAVSAPMMLTVQSSVPNTVTVTSDHGTSIPSTGAVTFTATAANGGTSPTYQWYVNGVPVSGATNATYTTSTLGEGNVVTCSVVSSEACAAPSTGYSTGMTMHWPAGITNTSINNQLMLIPNPNNGTFTIKGALNTNDETITIQVTNMLGQEVFLTNALVNNNTIDRTIALQQSLASGAYLVNVTTSTGKQVLHMVVNK